MVQAGLAPEGIQVIHNAIDTDAWAPERAPDTFRAELELEDSFPVVGYVGRIMPEKDLATWVRAAAGVAAAYPKAAFVLVGDGYTDTTQRELVGLAQDLGFADRLHFTGYRGDLLKVYAGFDCFMMTSRREGLPNSLLEAMALGLPVVTTDVAGAKELVLDGATGFVRPQGDVEGLGLALRRLAGDEALRRRLGQAGRQRVVDEFSFTRRMQRIEALYLDVVSGAAGTRGT
jgi:glycosyltransferase involved in cell wall biosynthesis